jgi:hypothetical protein
MGELFQTTPFQARIPHSLTRRNLPGNGMLRPTPCAGPDRRREHRGNKEHTRIGA